MKYEFFSIQEQDNEISDSNFVPNENLLYLGEYFGKSIFTISTLELSVLNKYFKINESNIKKLKLLQSSNLIANKLIISDNDVYSGYAEYNQKTDYVEVFDYDLEPHEFNIFPNEIYELHNQLLKFLIDINQNKTTIKTMKLT
jgi:hypothetical protein